jgi:hypothetical protein
MSWIGPRPEAVPLSLWYEAELPFYRYRHIVRPGITGWAQVKQGHVADVDDVLWKLHYDFYYIKNFSFWLDLLIVALHQNRGDEIVRNVWAHHHPQDGMMIDGLWDRALAGRTRQDRQFQGRV